MYMYNIYIVTHQFIHTYTPHCIYDYMVYHIIK